MPSRRIVKTAPKTSSVRPSAKAAAGPGEPTSPSRGARVEAVMEAAARSGLLQGKSGRIGGRMSPRLIEQAKKQIGIGTDMDLIEFALANLALDDDFAEVFRKVDGAIDPELKLGF